MLTWSCLSGPAQGLSVKSKSRTGRPKETASQKRLAQLRLTPGMDSGETTSPGMWHRGEAGRGKGTDRCLEPSEGASDFRSFRSMSDLCCPELWSKRSGCRIGLLSWGLLTCFPAPPTPTSRTLVPGPGQSCFRFLCKYHSFSGALSLTPPSESDPSGLLRASGFLSWQRLAHL